LVDGVLSTVVVEKLEILVYLAEQTHWVPRCASHARQSLSEPQPDLHVERLSTKAFAPHHPLQAWS
jgi:hypothetical protein